MVACRNIYEYLHITVVTPKAFAVLGAIWACASAFSAQEAL